jgi:pyruvate,water dikinase
LLEANDLARLHETSSEIQKLITGAPLPPDLETGILEAYRQLSEKAGRPINVSMRSSALGEDALEASFAGQYRSLLNVSAEYLILSYKEVVASKYSVPAMTYRLNKGFHDEDILMSVGHDHDPGLTPGSRIRPIRECPEQVHQCHWGLGKSVVDGAAPRTSISSVNRTSTDTEKNHPQAEFVCQSGKASSCCRCPRKETPA